MTLNSLAFGLFDRACSGTADPPGGRGGRVPVQENRLFEKTGDCHAGDNDLFVFRSRSRRNPTAGQPGAQSATTRPTIEATVAAVTPVETEALAAPEAASAQAPALDQRRKTAPAQNQQAQAIEADELPLFGGITDTGWRPDNHLGGSLLED